MLKGLLSLLFLIPTLSYADCTIRVVDRDTIQTTGCNGSAQPTPAPTRTPRPTEFVPARCSGVSSLNRQIGTKHFGVQNVHIAEGQVQCYHADLPRAAKRVRFEISQQCLTANFTMDVFPSASSYSDGVSMPSFLGAPRSANFGSLAKPAGYIPAQTFNVDVYGFKPDIGCPEGRSIYTLLWTFDE